MKFILLFFIATLSLSSWACEYRLQKDSILYNGYTINFGKGLSKVLADKGYERSYFDNYAYNVDVAKVLNKFLAKTKRKLGDWNE